MDINEALSFYRGEPQLLFAEADRVCRLHYGNRVYLRGLVEFSNHCCLNCLYCGIRRDNADIRRYRLDIAALLVVVRQGFTAGLRTFVLQSGEDEQYDIPTLCRLVEEIKQETRGEAAVTLSCGIRSRREYRDLRRAGTDRYLLRFETSDPHLHVYLRDGIPLSRRLEALADLKELGFETGSGFMVGLPGETEETHLQNALLCGKLQLDMVGIGPFIAHPRTPLAGSPGLPLEPVLRLTALVRLLLPLANIPATTATGTLEPTGREQALAAGANVLMPNLTPVECKKDYLLYPGKICLEENGLECMGCLKDRVASIGKDLSFAVGFSKSYVSGAGGNSPP